MTTCIHTVIKNEPDEYLVPWLNHHSPIVDHIYIFEDIGSHSHKHVTDRYSNVTLLSVLDIYDNQAGKDRLLENDRKGNMNQRYFILDGVTFIQKKNLYDWCLTADVDEFLTLQEPYTSVTEVLEEFNDKDAVILQWQNLSSDYIAKPDYNGKDYRDFYTKIVGFSISDAKFKMDSKIFWNLRKITRWNLTGLHCCAGNWCKTDGKKNRRSTVYDKMYLKHYITRSFEEYLWKIAVRGCMTKGAHRKISDYFEVNTDMLEKYDECMKFKDEYLKKNNINLN